ncbi:nitrogen fixation protein NifQ [Bradyrhizobium sp. ISRA443]|uniref:nitrogen fixation protein NifQ n=1 Tax=unclassified Bradyrhizobium TaxID=2631580 RepID=UPI0024793888|nr:MULTISPECIES: nitrogen fixation protein NifQ [unclassified Bradyrhizobium]WGR93586.1 nitrogen fixation protein NifQ [Bradyrhizobium sp. ISRA435]WGR98143.1 nitrogen fixation protein NifQ [Bradyrhizobium sp. ISRA436]WGS05031.1 nitrogen fixation protein NifQ [Bradyrhizobium sp. ISRA437]WGS11917.1 nitrogen fixation protein NifQ [Bradyrhizobium sp. ISRA443]
MFETQTLPFSAGGTTDASEDLHTGMAAYRLLTGVAPADADITSDRDFDRHVLASILSVATMDGGLLAEKAGLSCHELAAVLDQYFPSIQIEVEEPISNFECDGADEIAMVRDLLLAQRSTNGDIGRWLAAMIARRAIEPNHLWEDLGLRNRGELSRLLNRHFAPLAARNINNMRWKRFFYRMLCEDDGLLMCTTPVCTQCNDFSVCFGDESGESRMAERRRDVLLRAAP